MGNINLSSLIFQENRLIFNHSTFDVFQNRKTGAE